MAEPTPRVSTAFDWRATPAGRALVACALEPYALHLFSSREVTGRGQRDPDYDAIGASLGVAPDRIVRVRQVHGREVLVVRPGEDRVAGVVDADAVVTTDERRVVSVRVADCVPILLADRRGRAVAAVHAGWRGTSEGVVAAAVQALATVGVPAADLVAAIGPSIGPCCYQVDTVVRADFAARQAVSADWFTDDGPGRWRLDLRRANRTQLEAVGVPPAAIVCSDACTADGPSDWYSHRREGATAGRMVAAIRLRP